MNVTIDRPQSAYGPMPGAQTSETLTLRQIDDASIDDLALTIMIDPSQKRRIERRLIAQGRSASVYELARVLDPRTDGQEAVQDDLDAILATLDAETADRIEKMLSQRFRRISVRVVGRIMSMLAATAQTASARDDLRISSDDDQAEHQKQTLSASIIGERLVVQSANGEGWSIDLSGDADERDQLRALLAIDRAIPTDGKRPFFSSAE